MFIWRKITRHLNFNWLWIKSEIFLNNKAFYFRSYCEKRQSMPRSLTPPLASRSIRWWCPGPGTGPSARARGGSQAMWGQPGRLTSSLGRAIHSLAPTRGPWVAEDVGSGACWSICQYPSLCQPPWILMSEVGIVNGLKRLVMIIRAK